MYVRRKQADIFNIVLLVLWVGLAILAFFDPKRGGFNLVYGILVGWILAYYTFLNFYEFRPDGKEKPIKKKWLITVLVILALALVLYFIIYWK